VIDRDERLRWILRHWLRVSPWFPFDVPAWQSSVRVQRMDPSARACYLKMLIEQWVTGAAPSTPEACADKLGGSLTEWRAAWPSVRPCFSRRGRTLLNKTMTRVRQERIAFLLDQYERSTRGVQARAKKQVIDDPRATHGLTNGLPLDQPMANPRSDQIRSKDRTSTSNELTTSKEQGASPPTFPQSQNETQHPPYRVIERLAYAVLSATESPSMPEATEALKVACAQKGIAYDGSTVARAIESVAYKLGINWVTLK
jgi:hypothetical protein